MAQTDVPGAPYLLEKGLRKSSSSIQIKSSVLRVIPDEVLTQEHGNQKKPNVCRVECGEERTVSYAGYIFSLISRIVSTIS
jgi:hypothetical protein